MGKDEGPVLGLLSHIESAKELFSPLFEAKKGDIVSAPVVEDFRMPQVAFRRLFFQAGEELVSPLVFSPEAETDRQAHECVFSEGTLRVTGQDLLEVIEGQIGT
ncbi:MAG TPA: hypothetical protein VMS77_05970, partial [Conexivisphaerales archaeon]|nr:hypothetical protein [Conexivisphaerales archaeon]